MNDDDTRARLDALVEALDAHFNPPDGVMCRDLDVLPAALSTLRRSGEGREADRGSFPTPEQEEWLAREFRCIAGLEERKTYWREAWTWAQQRFTRLEREVDRLRSLVERARPMVEFADRGGDYRMADAAPWLADYERDGR